MLKKCSLVCEGNVIRFFAGLNDVYADTIRLSDEDSAHVRSLRLRPDELFTVCNGQGLDYVCKLGKQDDGTFARIVRRQQSLGEPSVVCRMFIAYAKGDRLDYAVQKSVELGAFEIILFESERCVAVPRDIPKKTARLQRIALETAKQCGRGVVPVVSSGGGFSSIVEAAADHSLLSLLCYEGEDVLHIKEVLEQFFPASDEYKEQLEQHFPASDEQKAREVRPVSIITGPEGGFGSNEVGFARSRGLRIVSLGSRVLRSETAPVVALSAIMYHTGNL